MTDCIISFKGKDSRGYPCVRINGRVFKEHRLVYARHNNTTLADMVGLVVMHTCDNPSCINPKHLKLGTHADNMADMSNKGRAGKGSGLTGDEHPMAKLTDSEVRQIKDLLIHTQWTLAHIAELYGVTKATISAIKTGRRWKKVK